MYKMNKITFLLLLLCTVWCAEGVKADITIQLSDVAVSAGNTAVVTASISDTGATPATLSAYNIPLVINNVTGFTFAGA